MQRQGIISRNIGFVVVLFCLGTTFAYAHKGGKKGSKCPSANLSEEQKASKQAMWQAFRSEAEGMSKAERREARAELRQRILDIIPETEEQRNALEKCMNRHRRDWCSSINLSEAQKARKRAMIQAYRAEVRDMSNKNDRRKARTELDQRILDTIPETEEQRRAIEECINRSRSWCPPANLSEEQKAREQAMIQAHEAEIKGMTKAERHKAGKRLMQRILDTIPETEEQRSVLEGCIL